MTRKLRLWVIAVLAILFSRQGLAATLPDCSQATVQAAIDAATDGDSVVCPAGSWSWNTAVIINNKDITLQGAGMEQTIISIGAKSGGLEVPPSNTKALRVTGFTFKSTVLIGIDRGMAPLRIKGGKGWRFHHNRVLIYSDRINWDGGNGLLMSNGAAGLVDHNEFLPNSANPPGSCLHAATHQNGAGAAAWTWPSQIGSPDNTVFVEDNWFEETSLCSGHDAHAAYGGEGTFYVFRHNTVINMNVDVHGFQTGPGSRELEVSNNDWREQAPGGLHAMIHVRGGTGVIYGNEVSAGTPSVGVRLNEWRYPSNNYSSSVCEYDARRDETICAKTPCAEGWPCIFQVGRGQNQSADPLYIWDNAMPSLKNADPSLIRDGRDFFLNQGPKPGYTAYRYPHVLTGVPCQENCGQPALDGGSPAAANARHTVDGGAPADGHSSVDSATIHSADSNRPANDESVDEDRAEGSCAMAGNQPPTLLWLALLLLRRCD